MSVGYVVTEQMIDRLKSKAIVPPTSSSTLRRANMRAIQFNRSVILLGFEYMQPAKSQFVAWGIASRSGCYA
jgi:hypothetical protein